ncbi:sugar-binding transcriptional regulator [uncultured Jannaschia sp.]|uniref:sugar-binding transcriptional regulator n=1 Tax=uncultured Jannaschia sp. TaxID=293347 RepID=UPI0026024E64|nr:sugar-binding domain-containing protein [uncultured Jannaschia sp.]
MAFDASDAEDVFVSEVCWHYYVNEMTQVEVARVMGVTRLRVNQAIRKARAGGMVRVQIDSPFIQRIGLQEEVKARFGIPKALIAPARSDPYDYHAPVGAALAAYLTERIGPSGWRTIGVSWGMTLESAARRLMPQNHPDLEIVSMLGGTTKGASFNTFGIASGFAAALGASYSLLAAPIYLAAGVDRDAFLGQEIFADHFSKLGQLDAAIMTASDVSPRSFLVANGLPRDVTPEELTAAGAVGDVLGRFLDSEGRAIDHPIDTRAVAIEAADVARTPEKILAAAGPHKVAILRAAIRRGLVDTLITDDVTARLLLDAEGT